MKRKKGISLIVLIVTIIVIIILAAVVILTITKNNPIESAKEATFKEDVRSFQDDLAFTISKEYTSKQGQRDEKITTSDYNEIKEKIPSFTKKYEGKFEIVDDKLVGTGSLTSKEKEWTESLQVSISGKSGFDAKEWDDKASNDNCFVWDADNTTIIGYNADELNGVTTLRIPSKCTAIKSEYANITGEDYRNFAGGIVEFEIPETVTEIGDYAFSNFKQLKNITIPENVTSIGKNAFEYCTNLSSIVMPKNLISIGNCAFSGCISLTNMTIPENVTSIGEQAFSTCSSLTSITIPNSVTSIGSRAFQACSSLTSVNISNHVESLDGVFIGCSSLVNITIPNGVTSISGTFSGCTNLASISIPNSVTNIGSYTFHNCGKLINIDFQGMMNEWNNIAKNSAWNLHDSGITKITCTDGVITL